MCVCIYIERYINIHTSIETVYETPVFWSCNVNSWLIGKVPDARKDWGQEEKRVSEDEMAGWYHRCNGHELGQTLVDGEGLRGLTCCSPQDRKESDTAGWLNNNNIYIYICLQALAKSYTDDKSKAENWLHTSS